LVSTLSVLWGRDCCRTMDVRYASLVRCARRGRFDLCRDRLKYPHSRSRTLAESRDRHRGETVSCTRCYIRSRLAS
jgi:hypothetical protein